METSTASSRVLHVCSLLVVRLSFYLYYMLLLNDLLISRHYSLLQNFTFFYSDKRTNMLGPLDVDLDHFGVSSKFGFLPDQYPLQSLPDQYYAPWEVLIRQLSNLIKLRVLRRKIDVMPILSTEYLTSEREWQRAYVILSFFTHGYIWGGLVPSQVCSQPEHSLTHP